MGLADRVQAIGNVYRVNAAIAQAAAGFLRDAGPQHLADVDIDCRNRYASIVVVALDGKPMRESSKLLVQTSTLCRPTGWTVVPTQTRFNGKQSDRDRILSTGKAPLHVENVEATITVVNPNLSKAVLGRFLPRWISRSSRSWLCTFYFQKQKVPSHGLLRDCTRPRNKLFPPAPRFEQPS